eukprot:200919_1
MNSTTSIVGQKRKLTSSMHGGKGVSMRSIHGGKGAPLPKRRRITSDMYTAKRYNIPPASPPQNTNNNTNIVKKTLTNELTVEGMLAQLQYSLVQVGAKHGQCLKDKSAELKDMARRYNSLKATQQKDIETLKKENECLKEKLNTELAEMEKRYNALKASYQKDIATISTLVDKLKKQKERNKTQQNDKYKKLNTEYENMRSTVNIYEGHSISVNTMSLKQLNVIKTKLQRGLNQIEEAREHVFEDKWKCVACYTRWRNISVDTCSHIALCEQCEADLEPKLCPVCQTAYKNVKKVNFD